MESIQWSSLAPFLGSMLETFFFLYGISIVAGSWLMLNGIAEAPMGYEDEEGFHYLPSRVATRVSERAETE